MATKEKENLTDKLEHFKTQVENFMNNTIESRVASERDRDYFDGNQWTEAQISVLKARHQAPVVVNRVKPKVQGLKGLLEVRKTDIKAFPRNYGDDESKAEIATDALRYVYDNNDFDRIKNDVAENKFIEGTGAAIVEVEEKVLDGKPDFEIKITRIPWDRFYYDFHSSRKDFKDARYLGQMVWMDAEAAKELFPEKAQEIEDLSPQADASGTDTYEDRPRWLSGGNKERKRIRIAQHFYIEKGEWYVCMFTQDLMLSEPKLTGYLDEEGKNICPIEADTAYIDRNNVRYGEVRGYISQQDEINHRRSKALFLLSSRQTVSRKGAISDVATLKNELAKPDGHIEIEGDKGDFDILNNNDFTTGQFSLYQDAKNELDATSFNAQLSGERQGGDLSGKAIERLQSAGALEVNDLYAGLANWERRIFRQTWLRIKQFWTEEKWIRVTEDEGDLRWAGFNTQITFQTMLEEIINDESKPLNLKMGASATYQALMQQQSPLLRTIVEVRNRPADLDVDIILEQTFDVVNSQQEQFQALAQFAQVSKDIDITELIELSQLKNKDKLIDKINSRREQMAQINGNAAQFQAQEAQLKNAKTFAETQKIGAEAAQKQIENQLIINNPSAVTDIRV